MLYTHRDGGKSLTPLVLHSFVVCSVILYVIAGAYMIQYIETYDEVQHAKQIEERNASKINGAKTHHDFNHREAQGILHARDKFTFKRTRKCVIKAMLRINNITKCDPDAYDTIVVKHLDDCYMENLKMFERLAEHEITQRLVKSRQQRAPASMVHMIYHQGNQTASEVWTFMNSFVFCFTLITTIGYGNVVPMSTGGRLFVIVYCCVGVPLAMLTIANLGKFLSAFLKHCFTKFVVCPMTLLFNNRKSKKIPRYSNAESAESDDSSNDESMNHPEKSLNNEFCLVLAFVIYILVGSLIIINYERLEYFEAVYFSFITLTTIGLGDIVPESEAYLAITTVYITVGVALSTIGIEIAAEYLKKLHYFGRKIKDVSKVQIWFGGQKLTMRQLVKNLGDQFNLPAEELEFLDLDDFVDQAIRVEAGEVETLRDPYRKKQSVVATLRTARFENRGSLFDDADEFLFADDDRAADTKRY